MRLNRDALINVKLWFNYPRLFESLKSLIKSFEFKYYFENTTLL